MNPGLPLTYMHLSLQILDTDHDDMLEDLELGDVAETVRVFFERSQHLHPAKKSMLSLQDVSVHNTKIKS
jgi:DNA ligase-3